MISIICPCYNAGKQISKMIASVLCQTYSDYELIIVDGMSDDQETLQALAHHEKNEKITIIREKDDGLYDAMNKGIAHSRGEWLYFIGADDELASPDVLKSIDTFTNAEIIIGKALKEGKIYTYNLSWKIWFENTILHQAAFYHRRVFNKFSYIPNYTVSSDYDLNLYLYTTGSKATYNNVVICNYASCGVSSNVRWQSYKEEIEIRNKYISNPALRLLLAAYSVARYLGRKTKKALQLNKERTIT